MTLGDHIKELRLARGLRQCDLASLLGIQPSLLSGIETGARRHVGEKMLRRICDELELSQEEANQLHDMRKGNRYADGVIEIPAGATDTEIHAIQMLASCVGNMPSLQFLALGQYLEQWRRMSTRT